LIQHTLLDDKRIRDTRKTVDVAQRTINSGKITPPKIADHIIAVVDRVHYPSGRKLFEVAGALNGFGLFLRFGQSRQEQCGQNCNNSYDHEQFSQGEPGWTEAGDAQLPAAPRATCPARGRVGPRKVKFSLRLHLVPTSWQPGQCQGRHFSGTDPFLKCFHDMFHDSMVPLCQPIDNDFSGRRLPVKLLAQ
jgi:hypothetical protein